ncbi:hypothetical protein HKI87_10g62200 [Chloropicon roscoffensis]|uniref:Uncharacterized protein n=2 Tax=Chloropicon roscoffensis TaxID=1461544 RepID=A0AAX4PFF8_9CHLO
MAARGMISWLASARSPRLALSLAPTGIRATGTRGPGTRLVTSCSGGDSTRLEPVDVDGEELPASASSGFKLKELDRPGTVLIGTTQVGAQVLEAARSTITGLEEDQGLQLDIFSFGFEPSYGKAFVRLDKIDNKYGSPTLDDIEVFSRRYGQALADALGEGVSDDIEFEVSSPGAEREIRVPGELTRFAGLPLRVELPKESVAFDGIEVKRSKNDLLATMSVVVTAEEVDEETGTVVLLPFKTKRNEAAFGRKTWNKILKSKKVLRVGFGEITRANIHLEF